MFNIPPRLLVVEDNATARSSLEMLARGLGIPCLAFPSAESFLEKYDPSWAGCLLVDLRLGGMSGLELLERLTKAGSPLPVILISAFLDVRLAVRATHSGAFAVLEKPYDGDELADVIRRAMDADLCRRQLRAKCEEKRRCLNSLTLREKNVMELLIACTPRKVMSQRLGIPLRTLERLCETVYRKTRTADPVALDRLLTEVQAAQRPVRVDDGCRLQGPSEAGRVWASPTV